MAVSGTGTSRANFGDLLEPGFRTIFFDQYEQIPQIYNQIFHVISTERSYFSDSSVSGFGQLVETTEGSALTYEDPVQGGFFWLILAKKYIKPCLNLLSLMAKTLINNRTTLSKALCQLQRLSEKDALYA